MRAPALLLSLLTVLAAAPSAAAATGPDSETGSHPRFRHYVALGDSYAAGPGIPQQNGTPPGCARSDHNYAGVLARWLRVPVFTDVSCSGATTVHMTAPQVVQGGVNPPQFDALTLDTDLVTLTVGGNDIGFGEIVSTCGRLGGSDPGGAPCRDHYTSGGGDVLADRVGVAAGKLAEILAGIRERAPRATVVVVGYLRILPEGGGCWPQMPFAAGDTAYFDGTERLLNASLGNVTRGARDWFVNPYPYSVGHDACQAPGRRWVEPLLPASPSAPVHPNGVGMRAVAGLVWFGLGK
ncbi:SGNH/GDSL hydrolase family protein [Actinokineospora enzanensis]|uniref:SGNH/GDSL hydrolase family protein n=1 Tax=Actinokineospora enzanensis TaxID=155975 RepID=UPI0009FD8908|nr:SGNH/GDSL hydrolase family protein [Actinokineospora enzanensis]